MTKGKATEEMERLFVEAFMGVAAGDQGEAARLAGSKAKSKASLSEAGRRLLKRASVQALIAEKRKDLPLVKDGDALREFWSSVVEGAVVEETKNGRKRKNSPPIKERLKASELLGKALGLFVKKVDVKVSGEVRMIAELPENGRDGGG